LDWFTSQVRTALTFNSSICHIVECSYYYVEQATFCHLLGMKVGPFWACLHMLSNDLEFLVNEVSLLLGVAIIMLQSHQLLDCHFLTSLIDQTLNGIYSWHKMVFDESMNGQHCYT